MQNIKTDILIAGGGVSGLIMALSIENEFTSLNQQENVSHHTRVSINEGIVDYICPKILIIERNTKEDIISSSHDIRNIALTRNTIDFFKQINIWENIKKHAALVKDIYVIDNKSSDMLHLNKYHKNVNTAFKAQDMSCEAMDKDTKDNDDSNNFDNAFDDFYALGYMIPYYLLKKILFDLVKSSEHIKILTNQTYHDVKKCNGYVELSTSYSNNPNSTANIDKSVNNKIDIENDLNTRIEKVDDDGSYKICSDLLIVADGKNSKIKEQYFQDCVTKDYDQTALVFNIDHTKSHENVAIEHFTYNGVFAVLPLRDMYKSSIVWSLNNDVYEVYKKMSSKSLKMHVLDACGDGFGQISISSHLMHHPIKSNLSNNYFNDNIVLIADSAHSIHPLAGQGLNQGIKDIMSLSKIIYENYIVGLKVTNYALSKYENDRKVNNILMHTAMDGLNKIFVNKMPILSKIRTKGLRILNKLDFIKNYIVP